MRRQPTQDKVFRRSILTLLPEWSLAGGIALALYRAADELHVPIAKGKWALILLPLFWAAGRTLLWAAQTWTFTGEGLLIVHKSGISPQRQVIHLVSARDPYFHPTPLVGWLGVGRVGFRATDLEGRLAAFEWAWLARCPRFHEILRARGDLSLVQAPPSPWRETLLGLWTALRAQWERWSQKTTRAAQPRGPWRLDDYGRFLAFCRHLLSHPDEPLTRPGWVPAAVAHRWIDVLASCRIVVPDQEDGWRLARSIHDLHDIHNRVGSTELARAVQRARPEGSKETVDV
jgi:hypothetical protein